MLSTFHGSQRAAATCHRLPTVGQHGQLVGSAEGALGADVHADGGEAEVVPRVVWLRFGQVQVPGRLRHEPAAVGLREEVGEFVDEPAVGEGWRWRYELLIPLMELFFNNNYLFLGL